MAKFEPARGPGPFELAAGRDWLLRFRPEFLAGLGMSLCGIGPEAGWVRCIPRDARRSAKTGLCLHHRMIIVRLCLHHPYQTGLLSRGMTVSMLFMLALFAPCGDPSVSIIMHSSTYV
ncbi:hypothetical protein DY000_02006187 [Brassica cretica]|uniref:Uncharacterized protein n=1 Tax=Brassica cretica TaxID=69181 RepID=A0ABQ7CIW2_BRACR|nr:hypothetical protein DY000_02006187 [Brassica cretica]